MSRTTWTNIVVLAVAAFALAHCSGPPPPYAEVQAIFSRSCTVGMSCHGTAGVHGDLDLSPGLSFAALVRQPSVLLPRVQRVNPGDPDGSWLIVKIEGTMSRYRECQQMPDACGTRMPMVGGAALSPEDLSTLRRWIAGGAPGP